MGRPWPEPGQPLFTEDDTLEALALQEVEDEECSGCGRPVSESYDPDNSGAYDVSVLRCHACSAREKEAERRRAADADMTGLRFIPFLDDE